MTHFEKKDFEEGKKSEHRVGRKHDHHAGKKHNSGKEDCCSLGLNGFQKFMALVAVVQIFLLIFIAVKISGLGSLVDGDDGEVELPSGAAPSEANGVVLNLEELMDDDAVSGKADAPVTIVEFSDYECPFCEKFYSQTLPQIEAKYIETGKVNLVFRDFPLGFHQNAQKAAEAAECAGAQGKYFEMHNKLFDSGVKGGLSSYKQMASEMGLNTAEFNACLDSGEMANEVKKDMAAGSQLGVSGTPAFFINGKLLVGAQPFPIFEQAIEQALANS